MQPTRRTAVPLTALCTAALLASCGSSGTRPAPGSGASSASATSATTEAGGVRPFEPTHQGGEFVRLANSAAGTLDPHVNYTGQYWQFFQFLYDGLVMFKQVAGDESFTVVPSLATSMPAPTNGGKTYVFTLRKGVKFSNGREVSTDDVVASFRRIFKVSGPTAGSFYALIVGADACLQAPATCTLERGVVADAAAGTVTINLTAPDPEFGYKLAVPHAAILPKEAPAEDAGSRPIPGTGAYRIESFDPNRELVMTRNPHFVEWSRAAQPQGYPDRIVERYGQTVSAAVTAVQNGQADAVFEDLPADRLPELGTKYADRVHVNPMTALWYLPLNVNLPPFDDVKARQAVNWAIDRAAVVTLYGGPNLASPACTFLPPGLPGHEPDCRYTTPAGKTWAGPDLAKARQLVQESGTAGQSVQVVVADDEVNRAIGENVASTLSAIGWKASAKPISASIHGTYVQNTENRVQISLIQWYQDYPAASTFLNVLLGCTSFVPGSDSSINISGYCDRAVQAKMNRASAVAATDRVGSDRLWAEVDRDVMAAAPVVPLINPKHVDFVSERVGNYQWSRQFQMIISQAWVK